MQSPLAAKWRGFVGGGEYGIPTSSQLLGCRWRPPQTRSRLTWRRQRPLAAPTVSDDRQVVELEPAAQGEYCMPGEVDIDNDSAGPYTILRIQVTSFLIFMICSTQLKLRLEIMSRSCTGERLPWSPPCCCLGAQWLGCPGGKCQVRISRRLSASSSPSTRQHGGFAGC